MKKTIEEYNKELEDNGKLSYNDGFIIVFRIKKKHFFEVCFGTLISPNQEPYFSTCCEVLNYGRTDYERCGQCQEDVLKNMYAMHFYKKWNEKHCKTLTVTELQELKSDIEVLKEKYKFIETDTFYKVVDFDREESKKKGK